MRGGAHGVAGERGQRRRVDALAADVADRDPPGAVADRERVVEVAADLDALARRTRAGPPGRARARPAARAAAATPAGSARPCARARRAARGRARSPPARRARSAARAGRRRTRRGARSRPRGRPAGCRRPAAAPPRRSRRAGTACRPAPGTAPAAPARRGRRRSPSARAARVAGIGWSSVTACQRPRASGERPWSSIISQPLALGVEAQHDGHVGLQRQPRLLDRHARDVGDGDRPGERGRRRLQALARGLGLAARGHVDHRLADRQQLAAVVADGEVAGLELAAVERDVDVEHRLAGLDHAAQRALDVVLPGDLADAAAQVLVGRAPGSCARAPR